MAHALSKRAKTASAVGATAHIFPSPHLRDGAAPPPLSLSERVLLSIRDCAWHTIASLRPLLEPRISLEQARRRAGQAGLPAGTLASDIVRAGRALLIDDAIAAAVRQGLAEVRIDSSGTREVCATPRPDPRFAIDPEFAALLPHGPGEVEQLEERLLSEGCRDPLVAWQGHGLLIDGYTRFALLSLLGRPYSLVEMEFADREAVRRWIWALHYGRRHYTLEAKSYVRGRHYNATKQGRGGSRRAGSKGRTFLLNDTAARLEQCYGVDRRTIRHDARFAAALDQVVEACGVEIRNVVLSQSIRVRRHHVLHLAVLDPQEQRRLVAEVLAAGKPPRFVHADEAGEVRLFLPLGQPRAQAALLAKKIGPTALGQLWRQIGVLLVLLKHGGSDASDQAATNHHAAREARDARFSGTIGKDDRQASSGRNGCEPAFSLSSVPCALSPLPEGAS